MAKLSSTRIYGSLIVDATLTVPSGKLNIPGGSAGQFLTYDGTWMNAITSLTAGTATSLAEGASPTITINNANPINPILNLGIPKGDKGATGAAGTDGKEVEIQNSGTQVQWKYTSEAVGAWRNIISIAAITGANGIDGKNVELQKSSTYVQWRYVGDATWINLIALSAITGTNGIDGKNIELQKTTTYVQWRITGGTWANLIPLVDLKGAAGSDATVTTAAVEGVLKGNITSHTHNQYLTSYAETDTLASVTARGNITTKEITTAGYNLGTTSATTTKATIIYNETSESIDFLFV